MSVQLDSAGDWAGDAPGLHGRIRDFVAGASFEMMAADIAGLQAAAPLLRPGTTIAIPWLPKDGRDSHDARVAAARALREAGFEPMPHIAARRLGSRDELDRLLARLADDAGVRKVFVIAGDVTQVDGPFASSLEVLRSLLLGRRGITRIGIAGYPEGHHAIAADVLASETVAKLAAAREQGLEPMVMTQFGFDADRICDWLLALRAREPELPVRVGLAGPASLRTLIRFAAICGVGGSMKALRGHGGSIARLLTEAGPEAVIHQLLAPKPGVELGPIALHLFPFGGFARTVRWADAVADGGFTLSRGERGFRVLRS